MLVHGSAADHSTWSIVLASPLRERFELVAYDRLSDRATVAEHAADLATLIDRTASPFGDAAGRARGPSVDDPAIVCGSSFGAVVALELARTRPDLVRGAVLIEPPMPATDAVVEVQGGIPGPAAFLVELDRRAAADGGPAAGEQFLRTVLGEPAFERIPRAFRDRAAARWPEIRADSAALIAYAPRYRELASMRVPVLLLGGERSAPYFRATLDSLLAALPVARLEIVPAAGHMLHAEAPRRFAELVAGFAEGVEIE